jgi:hypothetical protein
MNLPIDIQMLVWYKYNTVCLMQTENYIGLGGSTQRLHHNYLGEVHETMVT